MKCPKCGGKTKVVGVAHTYKTTIRRLSCSDCGRKFFSKEIISDFDQELADEYYRYYRGFDSYSRAQNKAKEEHHKKKKGDK